MRFVGTANRILVAAAMTVGAVCCSPSPPSSSPPDPDWIRFDPIMLSVDKPMPTIWIAPVKVKATGLLPYLIVLDRERFQEAVQIADRSCASAKGPSIEPPFDRHYAIVKSIAGAEQPSCALSSVETCATVRQFYKLSFEPGFSGLTDAFEVLTLRLGCIIAGPKF